MKQYFQPTQTQIDQVKAWLYDGLSMSQIGTLLGVTRNVVSGIIWRRPFLKAIQKQRFNGVTHWQRSPVKMVTKSLDFVAPAPPPPPPLPVPVGLALKDLGVHQCRYPIAHDVEIVGHYLFCAAATEPDRIYCARHFPKTSNGQLGPYKGPRK